MPKLYEYFGLRVYFYANERHPVHVHGFYGGRESKAELIVENGVIVDSHFARARNGTVKRKSSRQLQTVDFTQS